MPRQIRAYNEWLFDLRKANKFQYSILIAGNHDLHFDVHYSGMWRHSNQAASEMDAFVRSEESVAKYLLNESCVLFGIKFWGSPMTPEFCGWAFNRERGDELAKEWSQIPNDTNVLITHGPPYLHGLVTLISFLSLSHTDFHQITTGKRTFDCEKRFVAE